MSPFGDNFSLPSVLKPENRSFSELLVPVCISNTEYGNVLIFAMSICSLFQGDCGGEH